MAQNKIDIRNKKASHDFEILERFTAGLVLTGSEIKSIRLGKASLADAYCKFKGDELFVKMKIAEYEYGGAYGHDPDRERKLLLRKNELRRLRKKVQEKGLTIIPLRLYINERGLAKLEIALARGKKKHDKREDIKRRDLKREMERERKYSNFKF